MRRAARKTREEARLPALCCCVARYSLQKSVLMFADAFAERCLMPSRRLPIRRYCLMPALMMFSPLTLRRRCCA